MPVCYILIVIFTCLLIVRLCLFASSIFVPAGYVILVLLCLLLFANSVFVLVCYLILAFVSICCVLKVLLCPFALY